MSLDPLPSAKPVSETVTYRPISGYAIAGLACGCLFALLVMISAAVALVQGVPFFFTPWLLLLALAGVVLSWVAQNQIRDSEGTRAGMKLAQAGLWISLLSGLGYFAYYYVTGLALTNQANDFLMREGPDSGFFAHLKKAHEKPSERNAAFLLALPATSRGNVRPEDEQAMLRTHDLSNPDGSGGPLTQFRQHHLVRALTKDNAKDVKIEPLGVRDWKYENRSYQVWRNYRFVTPEATFEVPILVQSTEGESAGQVRKWYVVTQQIARPEKIQYTPLGEGLRQLRAQSRQALYNWQQTLNAGQPYPKFTEIDQTDWQRLNLPERDREALRARLTERFLSDEPNRLSMQMPMDEALGGWEIVDQKVRIEQPFKLVLPPQGLGSPFTVEGIVEVETKEPTDPARLTADPEWVIRSIRVTRAAPMSDKKGPPLGG